MNEIIRWKPFLAKYTSYDGIRKVVTFTCPWCGGKNCDRKTRATKNRIDDRTFWQGGFRCSDCGAELDRNGETFYYASDCFVKAMEEVVIQLTIPL